MTKKYKQKNILNESISERVFHFCSIDAAYNIIRLDTFKLANVKKNSSDKRMNSFQYDVDKHGKPISKTYTYYMCFSRTPSTADGYVRKRRMSDPRWKAFVVRFEFDGFLLNSRYKGKAVNAFPNTKETFKTDKASGLFDDHIFSYPEGKGDLTKKDFNFPDEMKIPSIFEHEDRLFSNRPKIKPVKRFIKEVDILIDTSVLQNPKKYDSYFAKINYIFENFDNVHIYDNEKSFNTLNIRDSKSLEDLFGSQNKRQEYQDIDVDKFKIDYKDHLNKEIKSELGNLELSNLGKILPILTFNSRNYQGKYLSDAIELARYIGLTQEEIIKVEENLLRFDNYAPTFSFIRNVEKYINKTIDEVSITRPETGEKLEELIEKERERLGIKSVCYAKYCLANKIFNEGKLNEETNQKKKITMLWLDDLRPPEKHFSDAKNPQKNLSASKKRNYMAYLELMDMYDISFVWVKTFPEFKSYILKNGIPEFVSFDRDLGYAPGYDKHNGSYCAKWLAEYCKKNGLNKPKYFIHSANGLAYNEITSVLDTDTLFVPKNPNFAFKIGSSKRPRKQINETLIRCIVERTLKKILN